MNIKKQTKDKGRYYPPEMMPLALCSACLDIIMEQIKKGSIIAPLRFLAHNNLIVEGTFERGNI